MEFLYITSSELSRFAEICIREDQDHIPVTPWRAISQSKNPNAEKDDVLLIAARDENGKIRGYIGILPVFLNKDNREKVYFNSCWWADPSVGGTISYHLFLLFLKQTRLKVIFSDLTEKTVQIVEKTGGFITGEKKGAIIRFRSALRKRAKIIKTNNLQKFLISFLTYSGFLNIYDSFYNLLKRHSLKSFLKKEPHLISIGSHSNPTDEMMKFIEDHHNKTELYLPSRSDVEWWPAYPWLVKKSSNNAYIGEKYYFSSFADEFRYVWHEVFLERDRIGVACLSYRDGIVKTLFLWYDESKGAAFFDVLIHIIMADKHNHSLITFHEEFINFLRGKKIPHIQWTDKTRFTAVAESIVRKTDTEYALQDGIGDYVFT